MAKRERIAKFKHLGAWLRQRRGDREISAVVRAVGRMHVPFDAATLRSWEYGWTGRPDPVRFLALMSVYGVTPGEALGVLLEAQSTSLGAAMPSGELDDVRSPVGPSVNDVAIDDDEAWWLGAWRELGPDDRAVLRHAVDNALTVQRLKTERPPSSRGSRKRVG